MKPSNRMNKSKNTIKTRGRGYVSGPTAAHMANTLKDRFRPVTGINTVDLLRSVDVANLSSLEVPKAQRLLAMRVDSARRHAGSFTAVGLLEPELHIGIDGSRSWRLAARYVVSLGLGCSFDQLFMIVSAGNEHSIAGTICVTREDCWLWGCLQGEPYGEQAQDVFRQGKPACVISTPLQGTAASEYSDWLQEHPMENRLFRF